MSHKQTGIWPSRYLKFCTQDLTAPLRGFCPNSTRPLLSPNNSRTQTSRNPTTLRDNKGRFTDGSGASKSSLIEIKGDELGKYKDTKELRQKAVDYYKKNLAGTKIYREEIGDINFVSRGLKEFLHYSASEIKLKAIVYIKDIIKTGEVKYEGLHKIRHDSLVGFWTVTKKVIIDSKEDEATEDEATEDEATVLIAKDKNGNLFYELFVYDYKRHKHGHIENSNILTINLFFNND